MKARHVVKQAGLAFMRAPAPPDRPDEAMLFLGDDTDGIALEVVGVQMADGRLKVIHAMAMRESYRDMYEEAKRWRM